MRADDSHEITQLLLSWGNGNQFAYDQLARLVYDELRRIAESQMRRERDGHTLSPSALVSEVFVKLSGCRQVRWLDARSLGTPGPTPGGALSQHTSPGWHFLATGPARRAL